jgi:hypothetical protein
MSREDGETLRNFARHLRERTPGLLDALDALDALQTVAA